MNHLDLFAGIGGFSLTARWMGWKTIAQVEWDEWCQKVLAKNFPDALRFGDIVEFNNKLENGEIITNSKGLRNKRATGTMEKETKETTKQNDGTEFNCFRENGLPSIGNIDIITGGFPCQPFSHAGKRQGVADERYLWPEMLRTIRILKPSFVVGENVAGLVSMENGKTLDRILSDLENEGYTVESFIIPACAVGAWHRRDRIWIVAHKSGEGLEGQFGEYSQRGGVRSAYSHKDVPDTFSGGQQGQGKYEQSIYSKESKNRETTYAGTGSRPNKRSIEPDLGMLADGLPSGLVRWDREPEGVPRVATGVKDRVNRLKGLGNAIVPQVAFQIFKAIESVDNFVENNTYR